MGESGAGGLNGRRYPWGDTISHNLANYYAYGSGDGDQSSGGYHPSYALGEIPYTSPVGSFVPNGYGLYEVAGNVSELCWDWWSDSYYSESPGVDSRGPSSGSSRVRRGGNWGVSAYGCRVAFRNGNGGPGNFNIHGGFRLARSSVP